MAGCEMRGECCVAEPNRVAVVDDAVYGVLFAAGLHGFESGDVLGHRNDLRAGEFLHERVAFHVIAVGMASQ